MHSVMVPAKAIADELIVFGVVAPSLVFNSAAERAMTRENRTATKSHTATRVSNGSSFQGVRRKSEVVGRAGEQPFGESCSGHRCGFDQLSVFRDLFVEGFEG